LTHLSVCDKDQQLAITKWFGFQKAWISKARVNPGYNNKVSIYHLARNVDSS